MPELIHLLVIGNHNVQQVFPTEFQNFQNEKEKNGSRKMASIISDENGQIQ